MERDLILLVDDIEMNRLILEEILKDKFDLKHAENGIEAVSYLLSGEKLPSIILLDIMMPEMDGYEVLDIIKNNEQLARIPVIFITAADSNINETKGLSAGAVDFISKPFNPDVVKMRVKNHLSLRHYSESLEVMVSEKVAELVRNKERMMEIMANLIEYRNIESGEHVKRTKELSAIMVNYLFAHPSGKYKVTERQRDLIPKAVPLHDIGKIGIPDSILLKPGRLTDEEYDTIKTHSTIGADIIRSMRDDPDDEFLNACFDICQSHHERWDGKGYPNKTAGEMIPLSARILSIIDVYDALVSPRVYKPPMRHDEAIRIITDGAGTQFDPYLVEVLQKVKDDFKVYAEDHKLG